MIARRPDVAIHVAAKGDDSDAGRMRNLVLIPVWSALVVTAGCTQTSASRWPSEATPAPTAMSAPANSPTPNRKPVRTTDVNQTWPNELFTSERFITPRSFDKDGYELDASYPQIDSNELEARRFNTWIKKKVLGYVHEFRTLADAEQRLREAELARRLPSRGA